MIRWNDIKRDLEDTMTDEASIEWECIGSEERSGHIGRLSKKKYAIGEYWPMCHKICDELHADAVATMGEVGI